MVRSGHGMERCRDPQWWAGGGWMSISYLPGSRRPQIAFVLGGGGNLGAVQVGMLQAVLERGYAPDAVVGCSVGAINGAAVATAPGMEGVELLRKVWLSVGSTLMQGNHRLDAIRLLTHRS